MNIASGEMREETGLKFAQSLERGEILTFSPSPFPLPAVEDREFLAAQELDGPAHKHICCDPQTARLHGHKVQSVEQCERLRSLLMTFSSNVTRWLTSQVPRYSGHWQLDRASYRPTEEATRRLRLHARNDLLHIDAFPTRPSNGWRILRVYANVNLTEPRVWITSEPFANLLQRFGKKVGLPARGFSLGKMLRLFQPGPLRSEYDAFMLRLHNFLKGNEDFQDRGPKRLWTFPPGSVWLAMTDAATHAELRGRHALEHSFFIAPDTLALPEAAPAALLARACGFPVSAAA